MNVVFDFGAVLFSWRPAELLARYFPHLAATPAKAAQLAQAVFAHEDWHNFDRGTVSMAAVIARTAQRLDLAPDVLGDLVHSIGDHLRPMEDSVALLAQLHALRSQPTQDAQAGLKLYFLSNMPLPYARALEQKHAFLRWFDGGIYSGDVLYIKPEPAIYQLLQSRYALDPAETLFIDDLQSNVDAACAQGWRGIHFVSAQQLQAALPFKL